MVALGGLRGGHAGSHAHAGGHGSHFGHASHGAHSHGSSTGARGGQVKSSRGSPDAQAPSTLGWVLSTLSPITIFSLSLGYGATGIVLQHVVKYPETIILALIGALVFTLGMVQPLMKFLGNFASKPSEGIEGSVYQEAEAVTGFDDSGRGIVRITLDGQHIQLLATLDPLELEKGIHVRKGEKLLVVEVDSARNSCRVTRELAS